MVVIQTAEDAYDYLLADGVQGVPSTKASGTSWLEILPRELILFDGTDISHQFDCLTEDEAQILVGDLCILGRARMGESVRHGCIRDFWSLQYGDDILYLDRQSFDLSSSEVREGVAALASQTCFGGLLCAGT